MKLELDQEERMLLLSSRTFLKDEDVEVINNFIINDVNWDSYFKKILKSGLSSMIYKNYNKLSSRELIPTSILLKLKHVYLTTYFKNIQKTNDFKTILVELSKRKIDFIPLKGMILLHFLYNDYGLRPMSDIDLLVKENEIENCKIIFLELGWEILEAPFVSRFASQQLDSQHPYTFIRGKTKIELHKKIHDSLTNYNINISDYWQRAVRISFLEIEAFNFSVTDLLQHLCVHLYKHLVNDRNVALKHFVDISAYIHFYEKEIQWQMLIDTSKRYGCEIEIREVLTICQKYFYTPVDHHFIKKSNVHSKVNCDFLFMQYVKNNQFEIDKYISKIHLKNRIFRYFKIKGFKNRSVFLYTLLIPDREYMIKQYKVKNRSTLIYYYVKRIVLLDIFKGLSS